MPALLHKRWSRAPQALIDVVHFWIRKQIRTEPQYDLFVADFHTREAEMRGHTIWTAEGLYCEWMNVNRDADEPFDLSFVKAEYERIPAHVHQRRGCIVPASDSRGRNGWFPLGQPSLVTGLSGAGKTKLILQILDAMRTGNLFLDSRKVPSRSVLWIQQDRGVEQLLDAYQDLFDSREPWFPVVPPMEEIGSAATANY